MKQKYLLYPYQIREYLILTEIEQVEMDAKYLKFVFYFKKYQ